MPEQMKRNTAYKLRIGAIQQGKPFIEGDRFTFLELGDKKIVRVNIVANVVEKFESEGEKKYLSLTIDDASGQIRIKTFGDDVAKFSGTNQGDTIIVIGNLRSYNNEIYILPEIIKNIDPRYLLVRKLEIEQSTPEVKTPEKKQEIKAVKDQIIDMIKSSESDGGLNADKLIMEIKASPNLINQEIQKLLEEGIIYEPRPGKFRFLG